MPSGKGLAPFSYVPLLMYENNGVSGLSRIEIKEINYGEVSNKATFDIIDILWMYGKWKGISDLPGWNGFIECLTQQSTDFKTSNMFLPLIDHPVSNYNRLN